MPIAYQVVPELKKVDSRAFEIALTDYQGESVRELEQMCRKSLRRYMPLMSTMRREGQLLRGDLSLKNLNNMADSSEKVSFRVDMQCSSLRAEAFLVFDMGSQPTLGQQITDMLPTAGRLLAEDFRKRR